MWDESTFQTYLNNNECPTDDLTSAIHERLRDPSAELATFDAEINELRKRLEDVQSRRSSLRASVSHYHVVLSPIRRLPDDVLREIFIHSLPPDAFPSLEHQMASPMLLTRVCNRWRSVAFSTPHLWVKLAIKLPPINALVPNPHDPLAIAQPEEVDVRLSHHHLSRSRRQAAAIEKWLERAGALPLSFYISHPNNISLYSRIGSSLQTNTREILSNVCRVLTHYSSRWRELQITISDPEIFSFFSSHLAKYGLPSLEVFTCVDLHPHGAEEWKDVLSSPLYVNLPGLRRLSNGFLPTTVEWPYDAQTWKTLTHLDITGVVRITDAISTFQKCPSLVHLQLHISPDTQSSPAPESQMLKMEFLQHLELHFEIDTAFSHFSPLVPTTSLYTIIAPELKHLSYISDRMLYGMLGRTTLPPDTSSSFPLQHILTGTESFDHLHITPTTQEACDGLKAALLIPECHRLPTLCIGRHGPRSRASSDRLNKFSVSNVDRVFQTLFGLPQWFIASEALVRPLLHLKNVNRAILDRELENIVCPNLQHIELLGLHSTSDKTVLAFVTYRLRLYEYCKNELIRIGGSDDETDELYSTRRKYNLAALTGIRLSFSRSKKHNIEDPIRKLAQALGVKLRVVSAEYPETLRYGMTLDMRKRLLDNMPVESSVT